jgi:hypothetical protein
MSFFITTMDFFGLLNDDCVSTILAVHNVNDSNDVITLKTLRFVSRSMKVFVKKFMFTVRVIRDDKCFFPKPGKYVPSLPRMVAGLCPSDLIIIIETQSMSLIKFALDNTDHLSKSDNFRIANGAIKTGDIKIFDLVTEKNWPSLPSDYGKVCDPSNRQLMTYLYNQLTDPKNRKLARDSFIKSVSELEDFNWVVADQETFDWINNTFLD